MKNKGVKTKVSDEKIIENINKGLNNKQILDKLGLSASGTSYKRLDKLRERQPSKTEFDLQIMDTIAQNGKWYRVTEIREEDFTIKRIYGEGDAYGHTDNADISKADYLSGKVKYKKRALSPVKCYVDESLKKPTSINSEFEAVTDEMVKENKVAREKELTTEDIAELGQDPAWEFDRPMDTETTKEDVELGLILDESKLARRIVDGAKMQIAEFVKAKEGMIRALNSENLIDMEMVDIYNMLLERYED